ncbi:MAG TPA: FGGY family carbohydrate kinase, partial [Deinococcales bacterium]|nr:FGGY family carbohydrate kinase [Deinococcales bacterium]
MREDALIGIDIGTTNLKFAAVAPGGRTLAVVQRPMRVDRPAPGEAEFHLGALLEGLRDGLGALAGRLPPGARLLALGVDSIGESVVPLDARGEPLGPCTTWFDRRVWVSPGYAGLPRQRRYDLTGMVEDDIYSVHRIAWFRAAAPQVARRVARWGNVADFAVLHLCGRLAAHPSLAARTGLLDRVSGDWSDELLAAGGLTRADLPEVLPAGQVAGGLRPDVAGATGLPAGMPVVHAGHDHPCALAGCGLSTPGGWLDSTGTAMAV